jgi:outer membrane protein OmpA-like peptidoglycan-associated protein
MLVAALITLGVGLTAVRHAQRVGVTARQPTMAPLPTTTPQVSTGPLVLPGGKTLDVAPDSAEAQMAHSLSDASAPLPHTFDFERLTFSRGSASVTPGSMKTVDDLAAMLKAYPSARIRIVGHTDTTGNAATNQTLSGARANAVERALVARGVGRDRIETSGEAARSPVSGSAPQGRINRRVEFVLLSR